MHVCASTRVYLISDSVSSSVGSKRKVERPLEPDEGRGGVVEISILCSDFNINTHTNGPRQRELRCHRASFWGARKSYLAEKCCK